MSTRHSVRQIPSQFPSCNCLMCKSVNGEVAQFACSKIVCHTQLVLLKSLSPLLALCPAQVTPGRDGKKGTRSAEFLAMNPSGQVCASTCPRFRRLLQQPKLARSQTREL